ncbi:MAG: hypothetical protein U5P41_01915 [Gammaproteobacteria bacterium]|nr:hypothetical protein [Gammaproteobacteria bacterium]
MNEILYCLGLLDLLDMNAVLLLEISIKAKIRINAVYWNVACANGAEYSVQIADDAGGSTRC